MGQRECLASEGSSQSSSQLHFIDLKMSQVCRLGQPKESLRESFFFSSYIRSKWKTTFKLEGGRIMQMGHHCPVQMFYSVQLFWHNPLDSKKLFLLLKPGRWNQLVRALPSLGQQRMKLTQPFFQNHSESRCREANIRDQVSFCPGSHSVHVR